MRKVLSFFVIALFLSTCFAQDFNKISSLQNVAIKQVYSENVEDSFYVYIKLPDGYIDSTKNYPVLFVMDADLIFPIACGLAEYLNSGEYIPEIIIVGIGYGTTDWRKGNNRSRDYTGIAAEGRPFEGGAPEYLRFIKDELIPMIEKNYRADKNNRILMGHSLGGQFVIYSMLSSPETFSKYIASSPFIFRIKDYYSSLLEQQANELIKYHNQIFISYGENELQEEYIDTITNFTSELKSKVTPTNSIELMELPKGEHFLNPPTALSFGLKWLFEK